MKRVAVFAVIRRSLRGPTERNGLLGFLSPALARSPIR